MCTHSLICLRREVELNSSPLKSGLELFASSKENMVKVKRCHFCSKIVAPIWGACSFVLFSHPGGSQHFICYSSVASFLRQKTKSYVSDLGT